MTHGSRGPNGGAKLAMLLYDPGEEVIINDLGAHNFDNCVGPVAQDGGACVSCHDANCFIVQYNGIFLVVNGDVELGELAW